MQKNFKALILILNLTMGFLAQAQTTSSNIEITFNRPGFVGLETTTVEDKMIQTLQAAASGSQVHIAFYSFSRDRVAREIVLAAERGVHVQLVLDGGNKENTHKPGQSMYTLIHGFDNHPGLNCKEGPSNCITFCESGYHSCRGTIINHNKFMIFSELASGERNVVLQTSANLTEGQLRNYNDLLLIKDNEALYRGYLTYWSSLQKQDSSSESPHAITDGGDVNALFFPRPLAADPVLQILNRVSCEVPGSSIHLLQSAFQRRGLALRLRQLKKQGCDVQVLTRVQFPIYPGAFFKEILGSSLIVLPYDGIGKDEKLYNSIHSKVVLIDAALDGSRTKTQLVLAGSHNLDFFSLRTNDETLLEISRPDIYAQYLSYWHDVLQAITASHIKTF